MAQERAGIKGEKGQIDGDYRGTKSSHPRGRGQVRLNGHVDNVLSSPPSLVPAFLFSLSLGYPLQNYPLQIRTRRRSCIMLSRVQPYTFSNSSRPSPLFIIRLLSSASSTLRIFFSRVHADEATRGWFCGEPIIFEIGREEAVKCEIARKS